MNRTARLGLSSIAGLSVFAFFGLMTGEGAAACVDRPRSEVALARGLATTSLAAAPVSAEKDDDSNPVGLWRTVFTASSPFVGVYDVAFQQFHDDGTEQMISSGVPPSVGNVCIGVWERGRNGEIRIRHVTWNWNGNEVLGDSPTGYFQLRVTLLLDRRGNSFSGTWRAASFDLDAGPGDSPQPGSEAEGTVEGFRITID